MVSSQRQKAGTWAGVVALSLGLWGCPDTQGEFEAYDERYKSIYGEGNGSASATCDPADIPAAGEIDGTFLFTLSAKLSPFQPVLLHLDMTTADDGAGGIEVSWTMQPLDSDDRVTRVGTVTNHGPFAVSPEDGTFEAPLGELRIPGTGNPFSDNELVANATLRGPICRPGDFLCGTTSGEVTSPITYDLEGSSYTFEAAPGGQYPEPPTIDCDGLEAWPVGQSGP